MALTDCPEGGGTVGQVVVTSAIRHERQTADLSYFKQALDLKLESLQDLQIQVPTVYRPSMPQLT